MKRTEFSDRFTAAVAARTLKRVPFKLGSNCPAHFRVVDDLVLMLILEISKGRATASWWMGVSFAWGYVPDGVPATVYERAPTLLTLEERRRLIGAEVAAGEGFDHWWDGLNEPSLEALLECVDLTEARFVACAPKAELRKCEYFQERRELLREIRDRVVPRPPQAGIPEQLQPWIDAAELVASCDPRVHRSKEVVRECAEDAAMCHAVGLLA